MNGNEKKMGRPKKEDSKSVVIHMRISEEELETLNRAADVSGKSRSELLRNAVKTTCKLAEFGQYL